MSAPLFSVIIPTYGRPAFLAEAIESVLGQTVDDLECIVVDDASPEPVEIHNDARVRLVRRTENGGPGAARNSGIREARGSYLTFLDDDDLYAPDRLEMATQGLSRSPNRPSSDPSASLLALRQSALRAYNTSVKRQGR